MRLYDNIDFAIVNAITAFQRINNKKYCFPNQETILECLRKYHAVDICRRTLNYRLRFIEDNKVLWRIRRHTADASGMLILKSTAYYLGVKFKAFLFKFKSIAFKIQRWCGVQEVAQYCKKSKDLSLKIKAEGGQIVNNLSFIT